MINNKIVVKVGTSTLTYENGKINYRRIEHLCKVLADLENQGNKIVLVSSGAIGIGVGKLGLKSRPTETKEKQALAAVGQCELMFMYDKIFGEYNHTVAQILLTKYDVETVQKRQNILNSMETLFDMDIIPIINENDTVAIDELEGANIGDNDMLSAIVAKLISADKLIILTDIDGLYDKNPKTCPDAKKIDIVEEITDEIFSMARGTGSNRGTGGMITKLSAASYANGSGIDCYVVNGENPSVLYDITEGQNKGTLFKSRCKI